MDRETKTGIIFIIFGICNPLFTIPKSIPVRFFLVISLILILYGHCENRCIPAKESRKARAPAADGDA